MTLLAAPQVASYCCLSLKYYADLDSVTGYLKFHCGRFGIRYAGHVLGCDDSKSLFHCPLGGQSHSQTCFSEPAESYVCV